MSKSDNKQVAMIHGTIGVKNGVSAKSFNASFNDVVANTADGEDVEVHIASVGGSIAEGNLIINTIKQCAKPVTTYNDSVAYSMAALIFLAGKNRLMAKNSLLMIHAGSVEAAGTSNDLRESADILDKYNHTLAETIATATGLSTDEVKAKWLDGTDHYFTADEAVAEGLATGIADYSAENMPTDILTMDFKAVAQHFNFNQPDTATSMLEEDEVMYMDWLIGDIRCIINDTHPLQECDEPGVADLMNRIALANAGFMKELIAIRYADENVVEQMAAKLEAITAKNTTANATAIVKNMVAKATHDNVVAELSNAQAKVSSLNTELTTAQADLKAAQDRVAELEKLPGAIAAGVGLGDKYEKVEDANVNPFAKYRTSVDDELDARRALMAKFKTF